MYRFPFLLSSIPEHIEDITEEQKDILDRHYIKKADVDGLGNWISRKQRPNWLKYKNYAVLPAEQSYQVVKYFNDFNYLPDRLEDQFLKYQEIQKVGFYDCSIHYDQGRLPLYEDCFGDQYSHPPFIVYQKRSSQGLICVSEGEIRGIVEDIRFTRSSLKETQKETPQIQLITGDIGVQSCTEICKTTSTNSLSSIDTEDLGNSDLDGLLTQDEGTAAQKPVPQAEGVAKNKRSLFYESSEGESDSQYCEIITKKYKSGEEDWDYI